MPNLDVTVSNHGSVFLVTPETEAAREWINENVATEAWQWLGGALAVEHRCIVPLVEGMRADGLTVE